MCRKIEARESDWLSRLSMAVDSPYHFHYTHYIITTLEEGCL